MDFHVRRKIEQILTVYNNNDTQTIQTKLFTLNRYGMQSFGTSNHTAMQTTQPEKLDLYLNIENLINLNTIFGLFLYYCVTSYIIVLPF